MKIAYAIGKNRRINIDTLRVNIYFNLMIWVIHMYSDRFNSLDELMRGVFTRILSSRGTFNICPTKGEIIEIFGACLELINPLCRLSRSEGRSPIFSLLGELLWYLSGSNSIEQIAYYINRYTNYSDDGNSAFGAYGPRIFNITPALNKSQWDYVIQKLKEKESRDTRNAVIVIINPLDFQTKTSDRPCTCSLQFAIREERLYLHTHMRSNDAYLGLPHDIFSFTVLQEIAAREIGVNLGTYIHSVGSLHLYTRDRESVDLYLQEGFFRNIPMPSMPQDNQWENIFSVLDAENKIRMGVKNWQELGKNLPEYWQDVVTILKIKRCIEMNKSSGQQKFEKIKDFYGEFNYKDKYELYFKKFIQNESQETLLP